MNSERCANSEAENDYQRDQDIVCEMSEEQVNELAWAAMKGWNEHSTKVIDLIQSDSEPLHRFFELIEGDSAGPAANFYNEIFKLLKDEIRNENN